MDINERLGLTVGETVELRGVEYPVQGNLETTINGVQMPSLSTDMVHSMDNAQVHIQLSGGGYFVMYDYYRWDKHDSAGNVVSSGGFNTGMTSNATYTCQYAYQNQDGVTVFIHGAGSSGNTYATVMQADGTFLATVQDTDIYSYTKPSVCGNTFGVFDTVKNKFVISAQSYFNTLTSRIEVDPSTGAVTSGTSHDFEDETNLGNMEAPYLLAYTAESSDSIAYTRKNLYFAGKPPLVDFRINDYHDNAYFVGTSRTPNFWTLKDAVHLVTSDGDTSYPTIQLNKEDFTRWMIEIFLKAGGKF